MRLCEDPGRVTPPSQLRISSCEQCLQLLKWNRLPPSFSLPMSVQVDFSPPGIDGCCRVGTTEATLDARRHSGLQC